jgi:NADPH:quinone reductase-like Zn-dependent oxidoreductase
MQALRVINSTGSSPLSLQDIDVPDLGDGNVVIAAKAAGISRVVLTLE